MTTSSLGRAEFVEQASEACSKQREHLVEDVAAYLKKHDSEGLPEEVLIANMAKATLVPVVEAEIRAVRKLGAPAGDEEEVSAILAAQQEAVDRVKRLKRAETLEEVEGLFLKASKMYRAYGFTACTNSP